MAIEKTKKSILSAAVKKAAVKHEKKESVKEESAEPKSEDTTGSKGGLMGYLRLKKLQAKK